MEVILHVLISPDGILMENNQIDNCNSLQDLPPCGAWEIVEFSKTKQDRCAGSQCRGEPDVENEDYASDGPAATRPDAGKNRMLMREWLEFNADKGIVPGLRWLDKKNGLISIAWKHGSKSTWSSDDGEVFESWAKYTGKYNPNKDLARKWKANFRCALNSLQDVVFVPEKSTKTGSSPCQVYRLLDEKPRRKAQKRRSSLSQVDLLGQTRVCQPDTTATAADADDVAMTSSSSKQTRIQRSVKRRSQSETKSDVTSELNGSQSSGNNNIGKAALMIPMIPTPVLDLCSEDEIMNDDDVSTGHVVDEVVCETQQLVENVVFNDHTLLLEYDQTSSIDLGFEDIELQTSDWPSELDNLICPL